MNAQVEHNFITFFLPHVSHRNPHACELTTNPRNAIDEARPYSVVVILRSQFAYGRMYAMLIFSIVAPIRTTPLRIMMRMLNRPLPNFSENNFYSLTRAHLDVTLGLFHLWDKWRRPMNTFWFHCNQCWDVFCLQFEKFFISFNNNIINFLIIKKW